MPCIVQQYMRGARNALSARFDGVEVHAANGYLLEQFIESGTNHRTDAICLVGMEACSGAHHIGRQLAALGLKRE
jgi:transposase